MNELYWIRRAEVNDSEQIQELIQKWLSYTPPYGRTESIASAVEDQEILLAVISRRIVGFVHYVMHNDIIDGAPNAFITAFYVRPPNRCSGIGTSLLESLIRDVRKRGAVSIEVSTTQSEALRFYERRGFRRAFGDIGESFLEFDVK